MATHDGSPDGENVLRIFFPANFPREKVRSMLGERPAGCFHGHEGFRQE